MVKINAKRVTGYEFKNVPIDESSDNQDKYKTSEDIFLIVKNNYSDNNVIWRKWISKEDHEKKIAILQERINILIDNCNTLEANKDAYKKEVEELKEYKRSHENSLSQQNRSMQFQINDKNKEIKKLEKEIIKMNENYDDTVNILHKEINKLKKQLNNTNKDGSK